jgi:hypothetical protein
MASDFKLIDRLEHRRSRYAVRSCAFSVDSKSIFYVTNDCHIWKYDFIHPSTLQTQTNENSSTSNMTVNATTQLTHEVQSTLVEC